MASKSGARPFVVVGAFWRCLAAAVALAGWGCGSRATVASDGGRDQRPPAPDHAASDQALVDRGLPPDVRPADLWQPDLWQADPDAGFCGVVCKADEVYLMSACVATDKLWTCAPGCDPNVPTSCAAYPKTRCEQWGGPPCCVCSAVVPACVPEASTGPLTGPLRIHPTDGTAGQQVTLSIQGAPFYIGALYYNVRMGNEVKPEEGASKPCVIAATFTPPAPGVYAVEVSQYGGAAPWVLAGFYTASGGSIPQPTIQPGYRCNVNPAPGDPACASAPPYQCSCVAGRCRCL